MANDLSRSIKIYIDNSDAMVNAGKLEKKIAELRAELKSLASEGKKSDKSYIESEKALKQLENSQANYLNKIRETERVLKNLSGATYKELLQTKKILRRELQNESRGTEQYTAKLKAYKSVQKQITVAQKEMNGQLGAQGTIMSRAANGFNKYFGIATTLLASITGISFTLRKLSQDAAQMEDVYADVMKTTGLTRVEVGNLNDEFKKMDTRTSREQLNMLARDAGKLGLSSKQDILDFVDAANQIQVALGEDLGEGAIREVGKIADVFTRSTKEFDNLGLKEKMLAVGSAINEIGASSSANEDYLVQFAGRLGGVATQAGLGIDQIIGFASALDQDMQQVEMSATALQQFIIKLMGDPAKFAKIAGLEVKSFTDLLKTDANDAIKTVLRALNDKGGFQQLIPYFDEMGLSGTRAVGVLSAMAGSIDKIDEAQKVANTSMVEAVSLTNEYNIKNRNAAAELEKRKKAFKDAAEELGNRLNPALLKSTSYVTYLVKLLPGFLDFLGEYGKYILYLATAYASYTAGVKLSVLWNTKLKEALTINNLLLRAKAAYLVAARIAMMAYNVVLGLVTGNFTMMRRAWLLLTASMATNPIGMIAVAATAAIAGIIKLVQWLNRTSEATKAIKEATEQYNSELASETREANALFDALRKTNPESATHLQIRKEIISRYGQYLQGLIDEKGNITDIGKAIAAVNNGLREQIALKIRNTATDKIIEDSINEQTKNVDKIMKRIGTQVASETVRSSIRETINRTITEFDAAGTKDYAELQRKLLSDIQQVYGVDAYKGVRNVKNVVADLVKDLKESGDAVDKVKEKFSGMISEITDVSSVVSTGNSDDSDDSDDDDPVTPTSSPTSDKNKYDKKLAALDTYLASEKNKILQNHLDGIINYQQYLTELERLEMEGLQKKMDIYKLDPEQQTLVQNAILEKRIQILRQIEEEEKRHQDQINAMQLKADEARAQQNWNALKAIAKQNEENYKKEFELENKRKANLVSIGMDFSNEMGDLIGAAIMGNEDLVASSLKNIINMGLDLLKVQVQMAIAGATAQSLAQPDSVATFGASGLARAAVLVGLIEAAFAVVKSVIGSTLGNIGKTSSTTTTDKSVTGSRVVNQRAAGKYDVIGADDGRYYPGVPYAGIAHTGFVTTPTLMGEYGRELVVSSPDLSRLQRHINYPLVINAINDARSGIVPQRASGNYSQLPSPAAGSPVDAAVMYQIRDLLQHLTTNGVKAPVVLSDLQRKQELLNSSRQIGSK